MKTLVNAYWESLRSSFWFVPGLMIFAAIGLSFLTLMLDRRLGEDWTTIPLWTYSRGPEGSRALLSAVAGSMVTIASLTFSITIVTLQLASSQYGPRLLRNFMRDQGNQLVLGTFIATFVYCLLILRTVNGMEDQRFVPHLSVTVGLLATLASMGVLIYFIHHTAEAIQAESVVASVGRDLDHSIDALFPESIGQDARIEHKQDQVKAQIPQDFEERSRAILSPRSQYLRIIDNETLLSLTKRRDLIARVESRPGRFVYEGHALLKVWPADRVDDELAGQLQDVFFLGQWRTAAQDAEFAIDQLVEVALRALSPGINDPFTAVACLDRLGASLCRLADRRMPSSYRLDEQGRLRVIADSVGFAGLVDSAFHQIRQAARSNAAVTIRLLEVIANVAGRAQQPELRAALRHHAKLTRRSAKDGLPEHWDRAEALGRFSHVLDALENEPADASS